MIWFLGKKCYVCKCFYENAQSKHLNVDFETKFTNAMGKLNAVKKFTDDFFDGLKSGAVNRALSEVKDTKTVPVPIIDKMIELDKAARELEEILKELE